jgi:hypothetical protein
MDLSLVANAMKGIEAQDGMCRPIYLPSLHQLKAEEKGVSRRLIMF